MMRCRTESRWALCAALALVACATAQPPPASEGPPPATCPLVRVEQNEAEADYDADSALLTIVYRPPGPTGAASDPVSTKVVIKRERVGDVQAHLESRPDLFCTPDRDAPGGYRIEPLE